MTMPLGLALFIDTQNAYRRARACFYPNSQSGKDGHFYPMELGRLIAGRAGPGGALPTEEDEVYPSAGNKGFGPSPFTPSPCVRCRSPPGRAASGLHRARPHLLRLPQRNWHLTLFHIVVIGSGTTVPVPAHVALLMQKPLQQTVLLHLCHRRPTGN